MPKPNDISAHVQHCIDNKGNVYSLGKDNKYVCTTPEYCHFKKERPAWEKGLWYCMKKTKI